MKFQLTLLLIATMAVCAFAQEPGITTINGRVLNNAGLPVKDAQVEFHPFAAWGGIRPDPVLTREGGYFSIVFPAVGQGYITASKVDEGYPDASLAIYGRGGYASLKQIDLVAGKTLNVELRFNKPNALLDISVLSPSGQPPKDSSIQVEWPKKTEYMMSSTIPQSGMFQVVLPDHPLAVSISAPGFATWRYRDEQSGAAYITAPLGAHIKLRVVLRPTTP